MVEAVTRAKGLVSLAKELGFKDLSNVIHLGTDSSAAKSFVSRRGLGRMRHLQVRDLWLQKEVRDGNLTVLKVPGVSNPSDLMTKILGTRDIAKRLGEMNLRYQHKDGASFVEIKTSIDKEILEIATSIFEEASAKTPYRI